MIANIVKKSTKLRKTSAEKIKQIEQNTIEQTKKLENQLLVSIRANPDQAINEQAIIDEFGDKALLKVLGERLSIRPLTGEEITPKLLDTILKTYALNKKASDFSCSAAEQLFNSLETPEQKNKVALYKVADSCFYESVPSFQKASPSASAHTLRKSWGCQQNAVTRINFT